VGAGYTVQGFSDLAPERSWNVSGALEWNPLPTVQVEAEAYTNHIHDLIESGFVGYTPSGLLIYSPRNVSKAVTQGVELGLRVIRDRWDVSAGYALLDARAVESDLPLDRRARHSGRVRLSWTLPVPGASRLELITHYTGDAPLIGIDSQGLAARVGTQEAFWGLNLQATVGLPGSLEGVVGIDNVFDSQPDGWQTTVERRLRFGLIVRELLGG
jgi:outer membrane receptor for ferrienterochelin and colicins